jgi:hypothetical protein
MINIKNIPLSAGAIMINVAVGNDTIYTKKMKDKTNLLCGLTQLFYVLEMGT